MTPRAASAGLCALAAIALLIGAFVPWLAVEPRTARDGDDSFLGMFDDGGPRRSYDYGARSVDFAAPEGLRANYGLTGGEVCERVRCQPRSYTGRPGLADDLFAWLGRVTMGFTLGGVALLVVLAFARGRRRPILRAWVATAAAFAAASGGAFVASENLSRRVPDLQMANGLLAVVVGAVLAGLGAAWPTGGARPAVSPARRYGLAAAVAVLAMLAWVTVARRVWWAGSESFDVLRASPLGLEVCDDGRCHVAAIGGGRVGLTILARLTVALTAAALVPALGTAARALRGVAPGAWAWTTVAVAGLALATGTGAVVSYAGNEVMGPSWGVPVFGVALAGVIAAAVMAALGLRATDDDAGELAPARVVDPAGVFGPRVIPGRPPVKPHLPALGAAPPLVTAGAVATGAAAASAAAVANITAPAPQAPPVPVPVPVPAAPASPAAAPAPPTRRTAPTCPTCRVSTLWHGKRAAWWCSTCKQTL